MVLYAIQTAGFPLVPHFYSRAKGDKYKIEYAGVAQDAFVQTIIYDDEDCRVFGPQNKPFIKGFKEKILLSYHNCILKIRVKTPLFYF